MKVSKKQIVLGAVASAALVTGATLAARAASDTSNADAVVITAIAITNSLGLDFATIVPSGSADTVVVDTADTRTCGGTLSCLGTVASSSFDVTGQASQGYAITLPGAASTLTSGANTMTVDTFTDSLAGSGTLDGTGAQTFTVGGTLNVGASQATGSYTGTFSVTVDYN